MRKLLVPALLLLLAQAASAQPKPKPTSGSNVGADRLPTIRGILVKGLDDYHPQVSPDGSVVALKSVYSNPFPNAPSIVVIDIEKRAIREMQQLGEITVDNRYVYGQNASYPETRPGKGAGTAQGFKMAGVFSDTAERVVLFSPLVYMVDAQAGRILGPGSIGAEVELSLYELKSGSEIRVVGKGSSREISKPELRQKNYIVCQNQGKCIAVGLNENDTAIRFNCSGAIRPNMADDRYMYLHPQGAGGTKFNDIAAYDRRTGRQITSRSFTSAAEGQMMYAAYNSRLYRYDRAAATLYEEEVHDTGFTITASRKMPALSLPGNQKWTMVACKGPSVLFVPLNIEAAEAGVAEANTATLVSLDDGKPIFRISPFYTRTAAVLAQQTSARQAEQAKLAKSNEQWAKEMEVKRAGAAETKAAACRKAWGNSQYNRGITRLWGIFEQHYVILESYDCDKDEYRIWQPDKDETVARLWGKYNTVPGEEFRAKSRMGEKQYRTCSECDGDGSYEVTEYTTKTKELPWGYFSGIETKRISTTAKTRSQFCNRCSGKGVVLK